MDGRGELSSCRVMTDVCDEIPINVEPGQLVTYLGDAGTSFLRLRTVASVFNATTTGWIRSGQVLLVLCKLDDDSGICWVMLLGPDNALGWTPRTSSLKIVHGHTFDRR
jgi:hypothetical protein